MQTERNIVRSKMENRNFLLETWWKFSPYWPLFLFLIVISTAGAWVYLKYTVPVYEASATIIIKDENKGVDDSKMTEALNPFATKKTVENETEVIKSRSLMSAVVKNLNLVAPIFEDKKTKAVSAYETSPIKIEVKDVDSIVEISKVSFQYDEKKGVVNVGKKNYPIGKWLKTNYGNLRFTLNESRIANPKANFYFSLISPTTITNDYISRLNVVPTSKLSTVLTLKLKDISAKRAENVLNELVSAYDQTSIREKNSMATNTLAFVDDRLSLVSKNLDSIEHRIQQYKSQQGATDISSQGKLFLENVSANDQKLSDLNVRLSVLNQIENYVEGKDESGGIVPSTVGVEDPLLTDLLNKLYENELEYDKLKKTRAENDLALISVKERINKIKPSILENIQSQKKSLLASRSNLYATNGTYASMLKTIPQKERDLLEISREQTIKTNIYNFLLQKREEAALSHSSADSNTRILDKAQAGPFPVWPNKMIIYVAAILVAVVLTFVIILLAEVLNRKVVSREDISLLTTIPVIGELSYKKTRGDFVVGDRKNSFLAEQFRKVRTSLPYLGLNTFNKRILITSSISGEGKSFIALNLARGLAMAGKKVVLIELDLINPSLTTGLALNQGVGIVNYLKDEVEIQQIVKETTENKNLYLIPAGGFTDNPSELIMNGKIEVLFKTLEEKFDIILIDTAPVGLISDAYFLSPLCSTTLFVVRHNYTPKVLLKRLEEEKEMYNMKNIGIIYNAVNNKGVSNKFYSYGYDYLRKEEKRITKTKQRYLPR